MSKQEEIRKGIDEILADWMHIPQNKVKILRGILITFLYGKGVVIKVNGKYEKLLKD